MPGTMPTFAEALQRMRGTNLTGQAAMEALYETLVPGRNINTAELAPFLAEVLKERAAPKLGIMKTMSMAEQGRFGSVSADMIRVASESGLEEGLARFWRTVTDVLKNSEPTIKMVASLFNNLTRVMQPFAYMLERVNALVAQLQFSMTDSQKSLAQFAAAGALISTKWGRVFAVFTGLFIILEDLAMGVSGDGESVTGSFFDWIGEKGIADLGAFEKAVFGVVTALGALAAAKMTLGWPGGGKPAGPGVPGGRPTSSVGGGVVKTAGLGALLTLGGLAAHDAHSVYKEVGFVEGVKNSTILDVPVMRGEYDGPEKVPGFNMAVQDVFRKYILGNPGGVFAQPLTSEVNVNVTVDVATIAELETEMQGVMTRVFEGAISGLPRSE